MNDPFPAIDQTVPASSMKKDRAPPSDGVALPVGIKAGQAGKKQEIHTG
jgi:hypothetical protein